MNTDRTNIPDFVYNVTGSCSIIAFICLNNSYNVPWTLQARRQRSLELAAESKQMPSTGPYNEVIDRADLETAGHPFHISFMAALIRAWRTVSNASQHSGERARKEEGKKKQKRSQTEPLLRPPVDSSRGSGAGANVYALASIECTEDNTVGRGDPAKPRFRGKSRRRIEVESIVEPFVAGLPLSGNYERIQ